MKLESVVPWGRSLDEYRAMFVLGNLNLNLKRRILGVGDGPASFNAEWSALGGSVVSVDPIYAFSRGEIQRRVEETYHSVVEQTRANAHRFVWDRFADADDRVFPLLDLDGERSKYLKEVLQVLGGDFEVEVRRVEYKFQRGGNEMLVARSVRASQGV